MSDFLSQLASQAGINPDQAQKGLGAILNQLKGEVPEEGFEKLQAAIPGAGNMMDMAQKALGGGILDSIGKMFGGGGLLASLSKLGFTPEQLMKFVPAVIGFFKRVLPPDLLSKVLGALPAELPGVEKSAAAT